MMKNKCDTCQFCEKESATFWTCRYNPPTVTEEYTVFPVVDKTMWCGKYAPDSIDTILALNEADTVIARGVLSGGEVSIKLNADADENESDLYVKWRERMNKNG